MKFWDASAIVPLCLREVHTVLANRTFTEDPDLAVWWATNSECIGAFSRRLRSGDIDARTEAAARAHLTARQLEWTEISPSESLRSAAELLLAAHPLRTADAFQLAAALEWCSHATSGSGFVCFDARLRQAAAREGFSLLPESL